MKEITELAVMRTPKPGISSSYKIRLPASGALSERMIFSVMRPADTAILCHHCVTKKCDLSGNDCGSKSAGCQLMSLIYKARNATSESLCHHVSPYFGLASDS